MLPINSGDNKPNTHSLLQTRWSQTYHTCKYFIHPPAPQASKGCTMGVLGSYWQEHLKDPANIHKSVYHLPPTDGACCPTLVQGCLFGRASFLSYVAFHFCSYYQVLSIQTQLFQQGWIISRSLNCHMRNDLCPLGTLWLLWSAHHRSIRNFLHLWE